MTRPTAMAPDASTSPVEWGPEIRVDGKRPEWLAMVDRIAVKNDEWRGEVTVGNLTRDSWPNVMSIRLPADHPHYAKAPTTPELDPALWDRMVALVHHAAENASGATQVLAQGIVWDLPKPVDPDLIEARERAVDLLSKTVVSNGLPGQRPEIIRIREGNGDSNSYVVAILDALRRGRELAGEQA